MLQHRYVAMRSYPVSDVIKNAVYKDGHYFNKIFSKGKTCHCKSISKKMCEQKLESSLIKSLSEKLMNAVLISL